MQHGAGEEAGLREEIVGGIDIAIDKDILPRDESVLQHKDGVVFIEAAGEGIVKRGAHHRGRVLIGSA